MMILSLAYYQLLSLNKFLTNSENNSNGLTVLEIIRKASILEDKLCDVFEAIATFYSLNIVGFVIGFAYFATFSSYTLFVFFKTPSYQLLYFLFLSLLWVSNYAPFVLWFILYSSLIEKQGLKTVELIQVLVNTEKNRKNLKFLKIINQQVFHRRPKISLKMFDMNWKFLFKIASSIFSFSIILVQFYDVAKS
jgi:hypothetical protein